MDLKKYSDIYDDVREIMDVDEPLDDRLINLNLYSKKFIGCPDRGSLRTILINLKSFRNDPILKITFGILSDELRSGSESGKI
jgi:hypothetical protein